MTYKDTCEKLLEQLNRFEENNCMHKTKIAPNGDIYFEQNLEKCMQALHEEYNEETENEDFKKGYEKGVADKTEEFEEGMRLLRATLEILDKSYNSHYVTSAMELTYTSYDVGDEVIESDGYCLREEIQDFLNIPLDER